MSNLREQIEIYVKRVKDLAEHVKGNEQATKQSLIGPFFTMPLRTYSEGMRARLMFAISTAVAADILILDEWLGAGDIEFMEQF